MGFAAILLKRRIAVALIVVILLVAVPLLAFIMAGTIAYGDGKTVVISTLQQGANIRKLARELEEKKIIADRRLFVLIARFHGDDARIQAGVYRFNDGMSVREILRKVVKGEIDVERFAVPEGYSIYQVAEMLDSRRLFTREGFLRQCFNKALLRELGVSGPSVEGYLYPSTYNVTPAMDEAQLIREMVGQFHKVYARQFAGREKNAGLDRRKIMILASMIEKEAVVPEEKPLISAVFQNRLKKGMRLQSDPTAVYGVRAFAGKVSKEDVSRPSAYNTYLISALPPGPVGNPGTTAIEAVLSPAPAPYLYFVARKDGTHHFSVTLDQHNKAVRLYLKSSADKPAGSLARS